MMRNLSYNEAAKILYYNPGDGLLVWKKHFGGKTQSGKTAGTLNGVSGYVYVCINRVNYKAHRVAWLLHYGVWPDGEIDHINNIRSDNRISNLRCVSRSGNVHNISSPNRNCSSGVRGVHKRPSGKWRAQITVNGKTISIGDFDTIQLAECAYKRYKYELHSSWRDAVGHLGSQCVQYA